MVSKKSNIKIQSIFLSLMVGFSFLLTAMPACAGFQWVPVSDQKIESVPEDVRTPMPAPSVEQNLLPLESPQSLQKQDLIVPEDIATELIQEPAKMKILKVQKQPISKISKEITVVKIPVKKEETVKEALIKTKVIISEDTPDSAVKNISSGNSLSIKAYPLKDKIVEISPAVPLERKEIAGFGSDMPLALALRQIVPAEYAFSFDKGVNPGYRVSWSGGKPWDVVVAEMIAPLNLIPVIQDKIILIRKIGEDRTDSSSEKEGLSQIESKNTDIRVVKLNRKNIIDPGQTVQQQPLETMEHVQELAQLQNF